MSPYLPEPGVRTELIEFGGGRVAQGAMFSRDASTRRPPPAVILVHGVESFWYSGPSMFLATGLAALGYTTLAYNGVHSGQGFRLSTFEAAVEQVGEAVALLKGRGFDRIFLAGHSLGTPIVEYYAGDQPDSAVAAIGVYGPHIDIPAVTRDSLLGPELYETFRAECRALVEAGEGDEIRLLPYRQSRVIVTSARSFLSYRDIETSKASVAPMIGRIRVPMLIVYDKADNIQGMGSLTRRESIVDDIVKAAVACPRVDVEVIPSIAGKSPVEAHLFIGNEAVVTRRTADWLTTIDLAPT